MTAQIAHRKAAHCNSQAMFGLEEQVALSCLKPPLFTFGEKANHANQRLGLLLRQHNNGKRAAIETEQRLRTLIA